MRRTRWKAPKTVALESDLSDDGESALHAVDAAHAADTIRRLRVAIRARKQTVKHASIRWDVLEHFESLLTGSLTGGDLARRTGRAKSAVHRAFREERDLVPGCSGDSRKSRGRRGRGLPIRRAMKNSIPHDNTVRRAALPEVLLASDIALALRIPPSEAEALAREGRFGPFFTINGAPAVLRETFLGHLGDRAKPKAPGDREVCQ